MLLALVLPPGPGLPGGGGQEGPWAEQALRRTFPARGARGIPSGWDVWEAKWLRTALPQHSGEAGMPGRGVSGKASAGHLDVSGAGQRRWEEEAKLDSQDGQVPVPVLP